MPIDKIVYVIDMRNRFMTTSGSVYVVGVMSTAGMSPSAFGGVIFIYFQNMLVYMIAMNVVKVTIVKIINVIPMSYRGVTAIWSMLV